jgi:hypothetical protein
MSTTYEVTIPVRAGASAASLQDVLEQALPGAGRFTAPPTVRHSEDDRPMLLVTMPVDAPDSSEASLTARRALVRAMRDAGLAEDSAALGEAEIRSST